jgi:hypothetical protein
MFNYDGLANQIADAFHGTIKQVAWTRLRTVLIGDESGNIIDHDSRFPVLFFGTRRAMKRTKRDRRYSRRAAIFCMKRTPPTPAIPSR